MPLCIQKQAVFIPVTPLLPLWFSEEAPGAFPFSAFSRKDLPAPFPTVFPIIFDKF